MSMTPASSRTEASVPPCLYCGAEEYEPRYQGVRDRLGHVPGQWSFWGCRQCGAATLAPFPLDGDLPSFYPPVYSFAPELGRDSRFKRLLVWLEFRLYFERQYVSQARRVLRAIRWDGSPGRRLLDVGCGRGLRLLEFRRRGFEVHGMDFQPEVVDYVRQRVGIPSVCTTVEALTTHFRPGSFDLVTSFFVIEHVTSVDALLRACFSLLAPGGWFVGAVPLLDSVQAPLFGARWINVTEAPRHVSLPTRKAMARACARAGFDAVKLVPDSTLNCAGQVGSSLLPGAAITDVYGGGRARAVVRRLLGGVATFLALPLCALENHVLGRPSLALVVARRPSQPVGR
jgi:SAM-dependent methyltransferase